MDTNASILAASGLGLVWPILQFIVGLGLIALERLEREFGINRQHPVGQMDDSVDPLATGQSKLSFVESWRQNLSQ